MNHRRYDYDVLRVCSMLGVIYLHIAAGGLRSFDLPALWNFSNLLACIATPAVPLFFMMSGALLLGSDRTTDLGYLLRKRLPRVLVPLAVYSAIALLYSVVRGNPAHALEGLSQLLNTPVLVPYWFLYALIPMYLISPLLRVMVKGLSNQHWNYMIILWVITRALYTIRSFAPAALEPVFTEHWTLNLNFIGGYLGYFLLGAYLERRETLPSRKLLMGCVVGVLCVTILGTRWDTVRTGMYLTRFTDYLALFTVVLSVCIFLLAKSCLQGRMETGKLLPLLAGNSFPVYLIHPLAIGAGEKLWTHFVGTTGPADPLQQIIFFTLVALFCIAAAVVCSSIPYVCYLFTGQSFATACQGSNVQALFRRTRVDKITKSDRMKR